MPVRIYSRFLKSMHRIKNGIKCALLGIISVLILSCHRQNITQSQVVQIKDSDFVLTINTKSLQFNFENIKGNTSVPHSATSGLTLDGFPIVSAILESDDNPQSKQFSVTTSNGGKAWLNIHFEGGIAKFIIVPATDEPTNISLRLGGMPLAHGLGDAGSYEEHFNLIENKKDTYPIINNGGGIRWASSFAIFPQNQLAGVFFDKGRKIVTVNNEMYSMSVTKEGESKFYYFLGTPEQIYASYKKVRNQEGYQDLKPKFRLFELGWESWDALGWNTNQKTVKEVLQKFREENYPIHWAVTGSGFWEEGGTTTSFGKWGAKFPNPEGFKSWMNDNDIKWMIGLRTNFVPAGGPYTPISNKRDRNLKGNSYNGNPLSDEVVKHDYFLKGPNGNLIKMTSQWFPQVPCFLLDGNINGAAHWYQRQYEKWKVDGIKEDTMMDIDSMTSIYNRPIAEIAKQGGLVMARNGAYTALGTLLRINDTRVGELSSRIPINYFQYAASGFPNVYSDVAGVHNMHNLEDIDRNIRHTWLLSLTSGLAVGAYPENWPENKQRAFKKAIDFHHSLAPYMYSAAIEGYLSGYPRTLTPLTIAYSKDSLA